MLTDVPIKVEAPNAAVSTSITSLLCPNGHAVATGDLICLECGSEVVAVPTRLQPELAEVGEINGWSLIRRVAQPMTSGDHFEVSKEGSGALLTLYARDAEPDTAVQDVLKRIDPAHTPHLLETGRFQDRSYEVWERISGSSLADSALFKTANPTAFRTICDELGRALRDFGDFGLRHREISPHSVFLRSEAPIDLVVTSFGSARLSDYDLEAVSPLQLTRYSAPETIVGGVSVASDWWSMGVILLEHITTGRYFEGINDKAFQIHVITRGISVPPDLDRPTRAALKGLLTRDPLKRWKWAEVKDWLEGRFPEDIDEAGPEVETTGPRISLGEKSFRSVSDFALAAAEAANWDVAKSLLTSGAIATWLARTAGMEKAVAAIRALAGDEQLDDDFKLSLALMHMNANLPLVRKGEIVSPAWLLANHDAGFELVSGPITKNLAAIGRERWLTRLSNRLLAVQEKAKGFGIKLDQDRLRVLALSTSRANLEAERALQRRLFPEAVHDALAGLAEHDRLSEEELMILLAAERSQFAPLDAVLDQSAQVATQVSVGTFNRDEAGELLKQSRRDIYGAIDSRIAGFARCSIPQVDEWADSFRIERRIALPRAAVLLSVPRPAWVEPPRQRYVSTLLQHFRRKVEQSIQQGPLVRFVLGKSSSKVDLTELGTGLGPAPALLDQILKRSEAQITVDPEALFREGLLPRVRRMLSHAQTFRRDTGIDGQYLGFPFIAYRPGVTDGERRSTRIAPVLLWPVTVDLPSGRNATVNIAFDKAREDVRLNPALGALVGSTDIKSWIETRKVMLERASLRVADVMDLFGQIAPASSRELTAVPAKDIKIGAGETKLFCCAALFSAEFTGQAIGEDLKNLENIPPAGTSLEAALRLTTTSIATEKRAPPAEERFHVVEADPSQEAAVYQARQKPGLLIEGPPGTGKSQTIVNIVADAVAKGETALVVCQKQVALQVVRKRLAAEGLESRLVSVIDPARDREAVVKDLREQVEELLRAGRSGMGPPIDALRRARREIAKTCGTLEVELNTYHQQLHSADDVCGLSYRGILSECLRLANAGGVIAIPGARPFLTDMSMAALAEIESEASLVSPLWLKAEFEDSPLHVLNPLAADEGIALALERDLVDFVSKEAHRQTSLAKRVLSAQIADPDTFRAWLAQHRDRLSQMADEDRRRLSRWLDLFKAADSSRSAAEKTEIEAARVHTAVSAVVQARGPIETKKAIEAIPVDRFDVLVDAASVATSPPTFWSVFSWPRFRARRTLGQWLTEQGITLALPELQGLLVHERALRPLRQRLHTAANRVRWSPMPELTTSESIGDLARRLAESVRTASPDAKVVLACPARDEAEQMATAASRDSYLDFESAYEASLERHAARESSRKALASLGRWVSERWLEDCESKIERDKPVEGLTPILESLPSLAWFQQFRARSARLKPEVLRILAELRLHQDTLRGLNQDELIATIERSVRREALLSWKSRIEQARPELLADRAEIEGKVKRLAEAEELLRAKNRELLRYDINPDHLGRPTEWESITRLRGARMKRLREIFDEGRPLGLMKVKPVWLMTPDVASRMLPLAAKLFDIVIFDEASQLLVEHALPSLFRAGRAVVSGDEKQMPPTSFFSSRTTDDEEGVESIDLDDYSTEQEREVLEETWNRRDIKDCPDLLALGNACFPSTTLQIHYRSKYRELIAFSNSAFYKGALSVPAKHPAKEIRRVFPIKVIRVDGTYDSQTNEAEARRVVEELALLWESAEPPSSCVVTFNKKQADLVDELIEERASQAPAFLAAYNRERSRVQNGEDMQFCVKNVENVQGDERDIVIFSTTFGRNPQGSFRRNFGALGQKGGERRLNVAVTRARIQVMLVTSMPISDVSDMLATNRAPKIPRDYLQGYLDYAAKLSSGDLEMAELSATRLEGTVGASRRQVQTDHFVELIADYVRQLGVSSVRGNGHDTFSIDLAVESESSGHFVLGIECDSPSDAAGHLLTARARDVWRPKILRRAIPMIHRVSSHGWYHDNANEKKKLQVAIDRAMAAPV